MNAAIYARKSTAEPGVAADAKSVTRQVENARAFAASKGWTVAEEHVYVDDGISGAEFDRRPGFVRMMRALRRRAPFERLVVSEQKSLGRESFETNYAIKQLAKAGVTIYEYVHGRCLTPRTWLDKAMSAVQSAADEAHREATRERVHERHSQLARSGYVTGGRVFGYRNVDVFSGTDAHGRPLRSHVERQIDSKEAAVVLRIFEMYDSGLGLKAIAKRLTLEHAPSPKPLKRNDGLSALRGWSPSTIRGVLTRELYRGVVVWNRSRKRDDWGQVDQRPRPESEWMQASRADLRVVPEELWRRVAARRKDLEGRCVRFESGRISGRPPMHEARNLLAGLATCGVCGGGLVVETSARKNGRAAEYVCHRRRHNGSCSNALRMPVGEMNEAVLTAIEEHALTPEAVEQVVRLSERDDTREKQTALERERKDVERRIGRLVRAIETGGEVESLVSKLRELEARRGAIDRERGALRPVPRLALRVVESRLAEWRRLLRQSTTQGRAVLQRVLRGRLTFTPRPGGDGYDFAGPTRFDKLFTGLVGEERPTYLVPGDTRGTEGIAETIDADYGELLERVYGKGLASPSGDSRVWHLPFALSDRAA